MRATLLVVCLAYFITQLDASVLILAIPAIIKGLHAPANQIVWSLGAYLFSMSIAMITGGRLGDMYGKRRIFLIGVAIFTIFSLASGFADNSAQLIAARALQGLGAALLTPQTMALLVEAFPAERRGTALGIRGAVGGVAAIAGPPIGGILVVTLGWRWIFFINVPIGVVMMALTWLAVPAAVKQGRQRLDLIGMALISASLFGIAVALNETGSSVAAGWLIALGVASLVLLALFIAQQRRRQGRDPLVPFSVFRSREYTWMTVCSFVISLSIIGLILVLSIYFQGGLGYSALRAGLVLLPASVLSTVLDPLAGKMCNVVGGRAATLVGIVATVIGLAWMVVEMGPGHPAAWLDFLGPMIVIGTGNAFLITPLAASALNDVSAEVAGTAAGVLGAAMRIGTLIGTAIVGAFVSDQLSPAVVIRSSKNLLELFIGLTIVAIVPCAVAKPRPGPAGADANHLEDPAATLDKGIAG